MINCGLREMLSVTFAVKISALIKTGLWCAGTGVRFTCASSCVSPPLWPRQALDGLPQKCVQTLIDPGDCGDPLTCSYFCSLCEMSWQRFDRLPWNLVQTACRKYCNYFNDLFTFHQQVKISQFGLWTTTVPAKLLQSLCLWHIIETVVHLLM